MFHKFSELKWPGFLGLGWAMVCGGIDYLNTVKNFGIPSGIITMIGTAIGVFIKSGNTNVPLPLLDPNRN